MTLHYEDIQPIKQALSDISDKLPKSPARFITVFEYEGLGTKDLVLSQEFSPVIYRLEVSLNAPHLKMEGDTSPESGVSLAMGQQAVDLWNKLSKGAELVKSEYSVIVGYTDAEGEAQEIEYKFRTESAEEAKKKALGWAVDNYLEYEAPEVKKSAEVHSCLVVSAVRGLDF